MMKQVMEKLTKNKKTWELGKRDMTHFNDVETELRLITRDHPIIPIGQGNLADFRDKYPSNIHKPSDLTLFLQATHYADKNFLGNISSEFNSRDYDIIEVVSSDEVPIKIIGIVYGVENVNLDKVITYNNILLGGNSNPDIYYKWDLSIKGKNYLPTYIHNPNGMGILPYKGELTLKNIKFFKEDNEMLNFFMNNYNKLYNENSNFLVSSSVYQNNQGNWVNGHIVKNKNNQEAQQWYLIYAKYDNNLKQVMHIEPYNKKINPRYITELNNDEFLLNIKSSEFTQVKWLEYKEPLMFTKVPDSKFISASDQTIDRIVKE